RTEPNGELSIEEQLIALVEGDLDPLEVAKLEVQLRSSEQLENERALFTIAKLRGESVVYPFKALLLDVEPTQLELSWASAFEGDSAVDSVSSEEKSKLTLQAGNAVFEGKSALKQSTVIPLHAFLKYVGVAAALVIGIFVFPFDSESPASAYKPYDNSIGQNLGLADRVIEKAVQEEVVNDSFEEVPEMNNFQLANYTEKSVERAGVLVPARLQRTSHMPEIMFASAEKQLLTEPSEKVASTTPDVSLGIEPIESSTLVASSSNDFVPLGAFIKGKVFSKLNLPEDASSTEGFSTLASRASNGLSKRTNNKVQLEAEKKKDESASNKRKFRFRIGDLLIRRD
ncbi:MAG: hypothetical protein ACPGED_09925, partial [Flavobacteriales bacterium]